MKIAIDPGHNVINDGGAVGIRREDELILQVSKFLTDKLHRAGHLVINCLPKKHVFSTSESLRQRVAIANKFQANIFVSIHFNAFHGKAKGSEIYVMSKTAQGMAKEVLKEICKLGFDDRGVKRANFYVLKNTTMPAMLIECCFCDRKEDMDRFEPEPMAQAIFEGLVGKADSGKLITPARISINYETYLKPSTEQLGDMTEEEADRAILIEKGKYTLVNFYPEEEFHYYVELKSGLSGFLYVNHCSIL